MELNIGNDSPELPQDPNAEIPSADTDEPVPADDASQIALQPDASGCEEAGLRSLFMSEEEIQKIHDILEADDGQKKAGGEKTEPRDSAMSDARIIGSWCAEYCCATGVGGAWCSDCSGKAMPGKPRAKGVL